MVLKTVAKDDKTFRAVLALLLVGIAFGSIYWILNGGMSLEGGMTVMLLSVLAAMKLVL